MRWGWVPGFLLFFVTKTHVWAYPHFIGYGYSSCMACHYNPGGNGPLTDYGRAIGATTIASRPFFVSKFTSDEKLGEESDFLGPIGTLPGFLRLSADYRGMYLKSAIEGESKSRYLIMQLDGSITLRILNDRLFATGTMGYASVPESVPPEQRGSISTRISREHYLAFRPVKQIGFYLGKMDILYGIRVPDHIAYSRSKTLLAQNDQSHGLMVHGAFRDWELSLHGFLGNLAQDKSLRHKGVSFSSEYEAAEKLRVGASALVSSNDFRNRSLAEVHTRIGYAEGSSLLVENGFIRLPLKGVRAMTGHYVFLQNLTRINRGFHFLFTTEYHTESFFSSESRSYRAGPGLIYFPMQRLEFRVDFLGTRSAGSGLVTDDTFSLLSQAHLWF